MKLTEGMDIDIMAGFNVYVSDTSDYRHAYGWSQDSRFRQLSWKLEATTTLIGLTSLALSSLLTL